MRAITPVSPQPEAKPPAEPITIKKSRWQMIKDVVSGNTTVTLPPTEAKVVAQVVRPGTVTMYRDGVPVEVPVLEIGKFQGLGFLLHAPVDLPNLASEIKALSGQFCTLLDQFTAKAFTDKVIDSSEQAELHLMMRAWNELEGKLQNYMSVVYQSFPIKEL